MKKYILLLPSVLHVVLFELEILLFFLWNRFDIEFLHPEIIILVAWISGVVCNLSGVICNPVVAVQGVKQKWDARELLRANIRLKYFYLPLNACWMIANAWIIIMFSIEGVDTVLRPPQPTPALMITELALIIGPQLWLGWIFHTGSMAIAGIIRSENEKAISKTEAVLYGVGSFIVVVDIIVAHLLNHKIKTAKMDRKSKPVFTNMEGDRKLNE